MFSTIKVGTLAPFFSAKASVQQQIEIINLTDYLGKWIVLFFSPLVQLLLQIRFD
jgi:peroxiredoxin (alkyl hydroperoxide reductase subunit C)